MTALGRRAPVPQPPACSRQRPRPSRSGWGPFRHLPEAIRWARRWSQRPTPKCWKQTRWACRRAAWRKTSSPKTIHQKLSDLPLGFLFSPRHRRCRGERWSWPPRKVHGKAISHPWCRTMLRTSSWHKPPDVSHGFLSILSKLSARRCRGRRRWLLCKTRQQAITHYLQSNAPQNLWAKVARDTSWVPPAAAGDGDCCPTRPKGIA